MSNLDYHSLEQHLSYADAKAIITNRDNKFMAVYAAVTIFSLVFIVSVGRSVDMANPPMSFVAVILLLISVGVGFHLYHRNQTIRIAKVMRFAKENNLASMHNTVVANRQGQLFNDGWERILTSAIVVPDGNGDIEIGNYRYVTGRGRSARMRKFSYVAVPHKLHMPSLFFDSLKNQGVPLFSRNHNVFISNSQKVVALSSKAFDVYAPTSQHERVAGALNQGAMYELERLKGVYDIEITQTSIVAFCRGHSDLSRQQTVEQMLQDGRLLSEFFERWLSQLAVNADTPATIEGGMTLKPAQPVVSYVVIAILVISIIFGIVIR